jgi:regulatory protein
MAKVTSIEKLGPVYRIFLDGRLFTCVDRITFERAPLKAGDEVDEDRYLEETARAQAPIAYEAALTALERAGKSEKTLRRTLALKGFGDAPVDQAIARLYRAGLLDDPAHAARMVETASAGGLSKNAIRRKLYSKGITDEDAGRALEEITDDDQIASAKKLAAKLRPRYQKMESRDARARLSQALARRGFTWDVINQALSADDE